MRGVTRRTTQTVVSLVPFAGVLTVAAARSITHIDAPATAATMVGDGWTAYSGAVFNLGSNTLRSLGWTSADAALNGRALAVG